MSSNATTTHQVPSSAANQASSSSQSSHNGEEPMQESRMSSSSVAAANQPLAGGKRTLLTSSSSSASSASIASSTSSSQRQQEAEANRLLSSNADYDNIRNTTLLFFLDRLYTASREGKEARTLHELSCLFGTKDFTKEMRQIVGASRNGLKRFLQSYPSLFTIEGDKVFLTQLKQESLTPVRDYNKEAVEYFKQKLLQFGTSLVPIKNLFGYRSQASQEVRHVSGKNTRDFKQFLRAHDDVFEILADEHVVLKTTLRHLEESLGQTPNELQSSLPPSDEISMDPYLNKQFAHSIEECMRKLMAEQQARRGDAQDQDQDEAEATFRISLDGLHQKIRGELCQNELFLKMVDTIEDLRVFLRMHPKLFKRFKCEQDKQEYVSLLSETERRELEAQLYPSLSMSSAPHLQQQQQRHSMLALERTQSHQQHSAAVAAPDSTAADCDSSLPSSINQSAHHQQPLSLPPMVLLNKKQQQQPSISSQDYSSANLNGNRQEKKTGTTALRSLSTAATTTSSQSNHNQTNISTSSAKNNNNHNHNGCSNQASSLRATAPPFVPSMIKLDKRHSQAPPQPSVGLGHRQNSHLSGQQIMAGTSAAMQKRSLSNLGPRWQRNAASAVAPIDQRGAIRNYLMKAQSNDHSSVNNNLHWSSAIQQQQQFNQSSNNNNNYSHHKFSNTTTATTTTTKSSNSNNADYLRSRTVDIVREASNIVTRIMNTCDAIAFDCKGYNLGFDGQITLIQFGFLPNESKLTPSDRENNNSDRPVAARLPDGRLKPEVCVFDLITNPELAYCLKPLLESDKIIKVVHDVRNKSNALHVQFKIVLSNVFDTQVANLVIQQQDTGKPAYKSRYISMSKLCEIYGDEELMKYRNIIKSKTRHNNSPSVTTSGGGTPTTGGGNRQIKDVNYWRARPLTNAMIFEATMDVYCLVGGIYQNLSAKIKPEYKPLFDQLNLEGVLARIKPDEIRSAKKERKIDLEVIDLKRKLYSGDTKSSIVLSNREIRLLRHIDLTEEVRNKIQQCKKVAKKLERLDMKAAQLQSLNNSSQISSPSTTTNDDNNHHQLVLSLSGPQSAIGSSSSSASSSSQTTSLESTSQHHESLVENPTAQQAQQHVDVDATTAEVMTNLMDGSMFDELKDKMIESSSLLESLEDDDDDAADHLSGINHPMSLHSHNGLNHDCCCRCQCHRSSTDASVGDLQDLSLKSNLSKTTNSSNGNNNSLPTNSCDNNNIATGVSKTVQQDDDEEEKKEASQLSELVDQPAKEADEPPTPPQQQVSDKRTDDDDDDHDDQDQTKSPSLAAVDMAIQCDLLS